MDGPSVRNFLKHYCRCAISIKNLLYVRHKPKPGGKIVRNLTNFEINSITSCYK